MIGPNSSSILTISSSIMIGPNSSSILTISSIIMIGPNSSSILTISSIIMIGPNSSSILTISSIIMIGPNSSSILTFKKTLDSDRYISSGTPLSSFNTEAKAHTSLVHFHFQYLPIGALVACDSTGSFFNICRDGGIHSVWAPECVTK